MTGDHVFAREFFLTTHRGDLPKAPTCDQCNNEKSKLEHYLTAVLPFGGRHEDALESLETLVPKRLERNEKLHRLLYLGQSPNWILEGGLYQKTMTLPIDADSIERLFIFIAKGLAWCHWKIYFTEIDEVEALMLTKHGQDFFEKSLFSLNAAQRVQVSLAGNAMSYEGVQGVDSSQVTVWRFTLYGGLAMSGDPKAPEEISNQIAVLTGPRRAFRRAELMHKFGLRINGSVLP